MADTRKIRLMVNGKTHEREVETRMTLVDFLRHELNLTGTHVGCEHGVCGACTVLVGGLSVRSCLMLAGQSLSLHRLSGDRRCDTGRCEAPAPLSPVPRSRIMTSTWFGESVKRKEDPAFLRGEGRYVDDIHLSGMLHASFVRSPYAHAK